MIKEREENSSECKISLIINTQLPSMYSHQNSDDIRKKKEEESRLTFCFFLPILDKSDPENRMFPSDVGNLESCWCAREEAVLTSSSFVLFFNDGHSSQELGHHTQTPPPATATKCHQVLRYLVSRRRPDSKSVLQTIFLLKDCVGLETWGYLYCILFSVR